MIQHILTHHTTEEHEYDPERALAVYDAIKPFLSGDSVLDAYGEYPNMTNEDKIVTLFELLNQSLFGDLVFSGINFDHNQDLEEREYDD